MQIEFENPKLRQSEVAHHLGYSSSTLQRNRIDIKLLPLNRILSNATKKRSKKVSITNLDIKSHQEGDLKRPRLTSIDLNKRDTNTNSKARNKYILKGGSVHEKIEINDK